eukprot:5611206-Prymnesium_polylepis.1
MNLVWTISWPALVRSSSPRSRSSAFSASQIICAVAQSRGSGFCAIAARRGAQGRRCGNACETAVSRYDAII